MVKFDRNDEQNRFILLIFPKQGVPRVLKTHGEVVRFPDWRSADNWLGCWKSDFRAKNQQVIIVDVFSAM